MTRVQGSKHPRQRHYQACRELLFSLLLLLLSFVYRSSGSITSACFSNLSSRKATNAKESSSSPYWFGPIQQIDRPSHTFVLLPWFFVSWFWLIPQLHHWLCFVFAHSACASWRSIRPCCRNCRQAQTNYTNTAFGVIQGLRTCARENTNVCYHLSPLCTQCVLSMSVWLWCSDHQLIHLPNHLLNLPKLQHHLPVCHCLILPQAHLQHLHQWTWWMPWKRRLMTVESETRYFSFSSHFVCVVMCCQTACVVIVFSRDGCDFLMISIDVLFLSIVLCGNESDCTRRGKILQFVVLWHTFNLLHCLSSSEQSQTANMSNVTMHQGGYNIEKWRDQLPLPPPQYRTINGS